MTSTITLPVWLFMILLFTALLVFIRVVVFPLWASFWSARTRNVVEEVNPGLQLHMSSFNLSQRRDLADRLACDPEVEEGVRQIAAERGVSVEKTRREAWRIAWDIVPAFNPYFYFRAGYRMARGCLRALYRLRVAFVDEGTMAGVSDQAAVVFIINHRSNIDYAVANYLTASRTMLSFGVGEWSRVWPIQPMMRMAGGYFVRRDSGDPLYRLMLKRYVQMATEARVPHAIFIEGQLSPDGSVGEARLGLLSYVMERFDVQNGADLVFMPIGINYDRIPEDRNMVRYSSAEFRAKGKRYVLLQGLQFAGRVSWGLIRRKRAFGYVCARFGNPISFRHWLNEANVDWAQLTRKQRYEWVTKLGNRLTADIGAIVPATPVPVLARIWFGNPDLALTRQALQARFTALCAELRQAGCHVVLVRGDEAATLDHALDLCTKRGVIVQDAGGLYRLNEGDKALARYSGNSLTQFLEVGAQ